MRWLLPFCLALGNLQMAACGSGGLSAKETGDAGAPRGTGGSAGHQTVPGTGIDAGRGGERGVVDAGRMSDGAAGASTSWIDAGSGGVWAVDAASDASRSTGGTGGTIGVKGGSGGTGKASSGGGTTGDAGVAASGGVARDAGPVRDGDRPPTDSANISKDGGTGPDDGLPGNCPSNGVCIVDGEVRGLFSGWGCVDMGVNDSLTEPTCDEDRRRITSDNPCTTRFNWNSENALCMTGSVPSLPATATDAEYDATWGAEIGIGEKDQNDRIGPTIAQYKTVTFYFSNPAKVHARAILHRKGDPKTRTYCIDGIRSGGALYLNRFNTKCWGDVTTEVFKPEEIQTIDYFALRVPTNSEASTVDNLCLSSLSFE